MARKVQSLFQFAESVLEFFLEPDVSPFWLQQWEKYLRHRTRRFNSKSRPSVLVQLPWGSLKVAWWFQSQNQNFFHLTQSWRKKKKMIPSPKVQKCNYFPPSCAVLKPIHVIKTANGCSQHSIPSCQTLHFRSHVQDIIPSLMPLGAYLCMLSQHSGVWCIQRIKRSWTDSLSRRLFFACTQ